jgi:hypothetical protein
MKVDGITVRPGAGTLVRVLSASGTALGDTTFLVTDDGVKYRVSSREALESLGFKDVEARTLPAPMLLMLPTGPELSREAASKGEAPVRPQCAPTG